MGKWDPDATLHVCWYAMKSFLPLRRPTREVSAQGTAVPLSSPLDDDPRAVGSEWWGSEHNALAFAKTPGVSLGQGNWVSVTKLTSRQLRVKVQRFQLVDQVSPDGQYFPSEKGAFMAEMECQASDMHCAKEGVGYDVQWLHTSIALCPDLPPD